MGMGEPLANYANVMTAVRVLHDPQCFNISARRITISTVGVPPRMRQLAEEELPTQSGHLAARPQRGAEAAAHSLGRAFCPGGYSFGGPVLL